MFAIQFIDANQTIIIPSASDEVQWFLYPFRIDSDPILMYSNKNNSGYKNNIFVADNGVIYISIDSEDTKLLDSEKYIQIPVLKYDKTTYVKAYGEINVIKGVGN